MKIQDEIFRIQSRSPSNAFSLAMTRLSLSISFTKRRPELRDPPPEPR